MGTVIAVLVGLMIGALLGRAWGRSSARSDVVAGSGAGEPARHELARAWQEGYDAGSAASQPRSACQPPPTSASLSPLSPPVPASGPGEAARPAPTALPEPAPSPPPAPIMSPEERAEAKARRDRRNVNITLYTACLLLVAAASLFIGAALPVTARVAGLAVVVGLFYAGGLVVHGLSRTVRPAAVAFTGTGLALLPVTGIALDVLVVDRPAVSWLITSGVGTVMMVVAAVRLDSRVVAYLTVPFLLSTVMASGAAVQQGMVWALIVTIGLAVVMAWLSVDAREGRRAWLPPAYREAIGRTHQWITPGAVLAGLALGVWITPVQMLLLLLAASAYYATVAVIGPRRFRLASTYAVRGGLLLALLAWSAMLDWSVTSTLTAVVVYLCLQVPLVEWAVRSAVRRDRGAGAAGYLPTGMAALADHGACWGLALVVALLDADGGVGLPALIVLATAAVSAVGLVRRQAGVPPLLWQAVTPVATLPLLLHSTLDTGPVRGWHLEIAAGTVLAVEAVILQVLVRDGYRARSDARVAPHGIAAAAVVLSVLVTQRWTDLTTGLLVGVWALLAWGAVSAVSAVSDVRAIRASGTDTVVRRLPTGVWAGVSVLALIVLLALGIPGGRGGHGDPAPSGELVAWYGLTIVTAATAAWWLARSPVIEAGGRSAGRAPVGRTPADRTPADRAPAVGLLVLAVGAVVTGTTALRFAGFDWHSVAALALLTAWLVTVAVLTRDGLPAAVRAVVLLAGQGAAALAVATATDLLGGDGSAARAAAALSLVAGMVLRRRWGGDTGALFGALSSGLVTAALVPLWLVEWGTGADRAALMVIAAALSVAGLVLGARSGGHWAVLFGLPALVVAASPWLGLGGGWLPQALFPTSVAIALVVLLVLAVLAREIVASVAGGVRDERAQDAWWSDPVVFRPVAAAVLWFVALILGLTGDAGTAPHAGGLAMTAAAGAWAGYVFARTRGLDALTVATAIGVPGAVWLVTHWWQDVGLPFPDEDWRAVGSALVGLLCLGGWALMDARGRATGVDRVRAGILWQVGLAVVVITALVTVLDVGTRAGLPGDAVVWTSLAVGVAALWLTLEAWGRTLLWPGDPAAWVLSGRDVAAVLTWAAASRAWWQRALPDHAGQAMWWQLQVLVLVLVGLGLWHALRGRSDGGGAGRRPLWCHLAAALVFTVAALYVLVDGTTAMQLTVLVGFGLLVVLGLTRRESVLTWWGASGVALSVLWYLRGYTYLFLALLGLALIVVAVWQLRRHQSR